MASRTRLMAVISKLAVPVNEIKSFKAKGHYEKIKDASKKTIEAARKEAKAIEKQILDIMMGDAVLARLYEVVTSVQGVGFVTATNLIIATNEFKYINDPRKLACNAGCAPFEHSSGTSIRTEQGLPQGQQAIKVIVATCARQAPCKQRESSRSISTERSLRGRISS